MNHAGMIDLKAAGPTVGVALILWGVLTLYLWVATFRLSRVLFLVFLTLWITFFLLGAGAAMGMGNLSHFGGYMGLLCGVLAVYGSFAITTNYTFGKTVLPLG
jgi:succinate-acetate transporter protein